jgi:parallel beta-helix repeat protein
MKNRLLYTLLIIFSVMSIYSSDFTVINTNDTGPGSLREAISNANLSPGADNIYFHIPLNDQGYNSMTGVWTIRINSSLPMIQGGYINIDATTQETNLGNTNVFGPEIRITPVGTISYPLIIVSPGNTIKGFIISGFEYGILIYNSTAFSNTISNNYIGVNYEGTQAEPNQYGIGAGGNAYGNTISDNIISGNTQAGIAITESENNIIRSNLIGTDFMGMSVIPNLYGIAIQNASNNLIGGILLNDRNLISGNLSAGIIIDGLQSKNNIITGNYIGISGGGCFKLPNDNGIILSNASQTNIGGSQSGQQNIISGNTGAGIILNGTGTRLNKIRGNFIGTNADGTIPLGNYAGIILKSNSNSNLIGGEQAGEGNLVSANTEMGIYIEASDSNLIVGNLIGTDVFGVLGFYANDTLIQANGVEFNTVAKHNRLGGFSAPERNIISGNRVYGMVFYGNTSYNSVIGNYIGTDITGTYAIPNATGICVDGGSHHNPIIGNLLSGNISYGIFIVTNQTFYNQVKGNKIGTNAAGTDTIPNDAGLLIGGGARYNIIGGDYPNDMNLISGNRYGGIEIADQHTRENVIKGNYIGTDISGTYALPNLYGISLTSNPRANIIDSNLISGNREYGLLLFEHADSNILTRNIIGTAIDRVSPLGNGTAGIILWGGSSGNMIGQEGNGNLIAYHDSLGILIKDNNTRFNRISANSMFQNNHMGIDLAPEGPNVNDHGDMDDGPNGLMNHPVIQHASKDPASDFFWAYGSIDTQQPTGTVIELFYSDGNPYDRGEGKTYLGKTITDASGQWMFTGEGMESGELITATATSVQGNTSEFSPNFMVITGLDEQYFYSQIKIFPNPVADKFFLECNERVSTLRISGITGTELPCKWEKLSDHLYLIELHASLADGHYVLYIEAAGKKTHGIPFSVLK